MSTTTALQLQEGLGIEKILTPNDMRIRVQAIQHAMKEVMKEGVHYGKVPGTGADAKQTLLKPGAELLLSMFRLAVDLDGGVEVLEHSRDRIAYRVTAKALTPSGIVVGMGIGECSTDEEKYKWKAATSDAEYDYHEGRDPDSVRIKFKYENQIKQVRQSPADLANTVLKMAKKRAMVDLCLTALAASDCFEQDLEDMDPETVQAQRGGSGKPPVQQPQAKSQQGGAPPQGGGKVASDKQVNLVRVKARNAGASEDQVHIWIKQKYNIDHLKDIPGKAVDEILANLEVIRTLKPEAPKADAPKDGELPLQGDVVDNAAPPAANIFSKK